MYVHEVYRNDYFTYMCHYRQTAVPTGLVALREIARTAAVVDARLPFPTTDSGLLMPRHLMPVVPTVPDQIIESKDIKALIDDGVKAWDEMLAWLGLDIVKQVKLAASEIYDTQEAVSPGGIILPSEPVVTEFKGYSATEDELRALELMERRINAAIPVEATETIGNYL